MKKIYSIETISSFHEVHLVEAENEEEAKLIVQHSDYNASKWLGQLISTVVEYKPDERHKQLDSYFFEGYAFIDDEGYLGYKDTDGKENANMTKTKIR